MTAQKRSKVTSTQRTDGIPVTARADGRKRLTDATVRGVRSDEVDCGLSILAISSAGGDRMYGTVAHMRLKPGMGAKLKEEMAQYDSLKIPVTSGLAPFCVVLIEMIGNSM